MSENVKSDYVPSDVNYQLISLIFHYYITNVIVKDNCDNTIVKRAYYLTKKTLTILPFRTSLLNTNLFS